MGKTKTKTKTKKNTNVVTKPITFSLPIEASENINQVAAARVAEMLPEIDQATRAFDRNNSATTLSMMTLTMLNGHSPCVCFVRLRQRWRNVRWHLQKRRWSCRKTCGNARLEEEDDIVSEANSKQLGTA